MSWNTKDLDFDARGRLIIHNPELANRILDAFNANGALRLVHDAPRTADTPFPDPIPRPEPGPRPDAMCECEFLLAKLNGTGFPPSPNV
jgi:hypothetical protein